MKYFFSRYDPDTCFLILLIPTTKKVWATAAKAYGRVVDGDHIPVNEAVLHALSEGHNVRLPDYKYFLERERS